VARSHVPGLPSRSRSAISSVQPSSPRNLRWLPHLLRDKTKSETIFCESASMWDMARGILRWRPTPVSIAQEHKAALARALQSRYRKIQQGMLYSAEGRSCRDFAEGVSIDLGMVLIGLAECLGSRKLAEDTLKDIIALFLQSFDPSPQDREYIEAKRFNLDRQFEMLRVWRAAGSERRIDAVLLIAARFLFAADNADLPRIAKLLSPDAWPIYVRTLHVFGRTVHSAGLEKPETKSEARLDG
jgi:hypothetical protein